MSRWLEQQARLVPKYWQMYTKVFASLGNIWEPIQVGPIFKNGLNVLPAVRSVAVLARIL